MTDTARAERPEPRLKLIYATGTVKSESETPALDYAAALQRVQTQNEYLAKLIEAQAEKLARIEQLTTTTATAVNSATMHSVVLFPSDYPMASASVIAGDPNWAHLWPDTFMVANVHEREDSAGSPVTSQSRLVLGRDRRVPLYLLLEIGSLGAAILSTGSLVMWLFGSVPLINPFASLLAIVASPFFFAMGRVVRPNKI